MRILETERLFIDELNETDAPFIMELLNGESWIRYIGDRGIKNLNDAGKYIRNGPVASYRKYGYGLWAIRLKSDSETVGICGLLKRDFLDDTDIGYALLSRHEGKGYASEAAAAIMEYAATVLNISRVVAITVPDNERSLSLLKKVGMEYEGVIQYPETGEDLLLYSVILQKLPDRYCGI